MIHSEVICGPDTISNYYDDWERLLVSPHNEPSTSFEWTQALIQHHASRFSDFYLIIFRDDRNNIVGIFPIISLKEKLLGLDLVTVTPISDLYNTHSDILCENFNLELFSCLLDTLYSLPFKWDVFRMKRVLYDNPLFEILDSNYPANFPVPHIQPNINSFILYPGNSYAKYLTDRSGKFRNHLKRYTSKLQNAGDMKYAIAGIDIDIDTSYDYLLDIEKSSWKHDHGTAISRINRQEAFYRELCAETHKTDRLHLIFLLFDGEPIAYNLGYLLDSKYYYLKTSYKNSFKNFSPSTILRARLIEILINKGTEFIDFPGEAYCWEKQWTHKFRQNYSLFFYRRSISSSIFRLVKYLKRLFSAKSISDNLDYTDPRKLLPKTKR